MSQDLLDSSKILGKYGLKPNRALGQNFLSDPASLQCVVEAARILPGDTVLEIGPGLGSLTRLLCRQARQVIAVEVDAGFVTVLNDVLAEFENLEIIHGDILELDPAQLMKSPGYLVVANIPYYITSAIFRHLLGGKYPPKRLVLTLQLEVAQRICASPGELSLLALSVQVYGKPEIAAKIPAHAFYPAPKVDSAVVRVEIYSDPLIPTSHLARFFRLAKAGFSQKRKTLRNSLSAGMGWGSQQTEELLLSIGINPQRRAETLSLQEWYALAMTSEVEPGGS